MMCALVAASNHHRLFRYQMTVAVRCFRATASGKTYHTSDEAIADINAQPRPLAAYYFGDNLERQQQSMHQTTYGGLVINGVIDPRFNRQLAIRRGRRLPRHPRFPAFYLRVVQRSDGVSDLRLRAPYGDRTPALEAFFNG